MRRRIDSYIPSNMPEELFKEMAVNFITDKILGNLKYTEAG